MSGLLGYLIFRALWGFAGILPEPVMRHLGRGAGHVMWFLHPARRAMAQRHQRRIQGPGVDVRRASHRVFANYGRYYAEVFWMRPRRRRRVIEQAELEGLTILHEAVAAPTGTVLAVGHLGNWEAAGLKAASEGARVLAVAEALANERLVRWFVQMRAMMDIDIVLTGRGARATDALVERLERGGTVALLCDRDLKRNGVPVTLFGEETTMPTGPISLACRTGATVLPVGVYFQEKAGHRFHIHPPLDVPTEGTLEERVQEGTRRLAVALEGLIREAPEQWLVVVPNWPSDRETP